MSMQHDPYKWWKSAMRGEQVFVHADNPEPGYFRTKLCKGGPFVPAAIWWHTPVDEDGVVTGDDVLVCTVGFNLRHVDPYEKWVWLAKNPISKDLYFAAVESGAWPNVDEHVDDDACATTPEDFSEKISKAAAGAKQYASVGDELAAEKAQTLRSHLLDLAREADKVRTEEKKPFLEGGRAVDAKWQPILKEAQDAAGLIVRALSAFKTAQARQHREERRNEPISTRIQGGSGRAARAKPMRQVVEVADWPELVEFLRSAFPEFEDISIKLANRALRNGMDVPGVKTEDIMDVA